jgi:actin-related protein 5
VYASPVLDCLSTDEFFKWMYRNFCEFADDYSLQLRRLKDPLNIIASTKLVQYPFAAPVKNQFTNI